MAGAYDRYDPLSGNYIPADYKKTAEESAAAASATSKDSFDVTIKLPLTRSNMSFSFWFNYLYQDKDTLLISEGPRSPIVTHGFDVPNLTKGVQNLVLTAGFKSYGVKFTLDPTSIQEDVVILESLTANFANPQIVYTGTSTSVSINTSDFAPRWVKVRSRDKWLTQNNTEVIAIGPDAGGSVTPKNADPDTSTPPSAPTGVSVIGTLDANDKSGFSGTVTASWLANTDTNTSGYVIRWSTQNPDTVTNPVWEYGQVDGRTTTTFTVSGLLPNTLYYYQVTSKSPYNAISWASPQSGTFGPIVDTNAPADVFAQLRSVLSIGGKTADLFKIGTGIAQSINTSTTITPSQTAGTYSGIILNKSTTNFGHNYWLNTGQFRVGSGTAFLYWDGSDLYTTGKINATGGQFSSGDVQLNGGTLFAGASPNSGARMRFNSSGIFAYNASNVQTVAITQSDGKIDARQGYIGGWTINASDQTTGTISKNGTILDSSGNITLGDVTGTLPSIVRLSSTDTYRIWVGSQSSSTAAFKVHSNGTLYATGAEISGNITANSLAIGTTYNGTSLTDIKNNSDKGASAIQPDGTTTGSIQVDATTRRINKILASQGMPVMTGGTNPVILDHTGLRMLSSDGVNPSILLNASNGTAIFRGTVYAAAGQFSGLITSASINVTGEDFTSSVTNNEDGGPSTIVSTVRNAFSTLYTRAGIPSLGVNAISFISANSGGWVSSCYPFTDNAVDLGIKSGTGYSTYRWRNLRLTGSAYFGGTGSTNSTDLVATGGAVTKIFSDGSIYANSLNANSPGTSTGGSLVQNASGYLRVASSSKRFKENIVEISKLGYLDAAMQIKPVNFSYIGEGETISGLIAEDLNEIDKFKGVVNYDIDGLPSSIAYDRMASLLVLAIKEIKDKLDGIEQRLDALEG